MYIGFYFFIKRSGSFVMKKFIPLLKFFAIFLGIILFVKVTYAGWGNVVGGLGGAALAGAGAGGVLIGIVISLFGFGAAGFCWFCDLYKTLFDIMNKLATNVATSLRNDFLLLLGVGLLFYLAFKIGSTVVKLQEVDLMQFLGELFKHMGRAMIAAAFLFGTVQMYHYLISPFLAYSLALTHELMTQRNANTVTELTTKLLGGSKDGSGFMPTVTAEILNEGGTMAFSNQIRDQLIGILKLTSASLIAGMIIGAVIILISFADAYLSIIPNFQLMIVGFTILAAYFGVYLAVPFKLIDVMVRLTFVAALTPLWIILWIFPATANYTKNAWEMLLNCCACIICLGVVLVITFEILESMLPDKEAIILLLLGGLDMLATGQMNLINPAVLQTFALGTLATSLVKNSSNIATQIVKSYGTSIGEGMDKAVGQGISSMGKVGAALGGASLALAGGNIKDMMSMGKSAHKSVQGSSLPDWLGGSYQDKKRADTVTDSNQKMAALEKNPRTSSQDAEYTALKKERNENAKNRMDRLAERIQEETDPKKKAELQKQWDACKFLVDNPNATATEYNNFLNKQKGGTQGSGTQGSGTQGEGAPKPQKPAPKK